MERGFENNQSKFPFPGFYGTNITEWNLYLENGVFSIPTTAFLCKNIKRETCLIKINSVTRILS